MDNRAKIVNIRIEATQSGLFRATSTDLVGIHAAAKSIEELQLAVKEMIADLFEAQGENVVVLETEEKHNSAVSPWVVVPKTAVARAC
ncbi:hypothetical protein [uncultured Roseobacter sp.]|uniref:hypothetical protein n=1 Tax=uncultured Roseobacter sp. TaxID=114847 RepID=UPI00262B3736|nr:hypothetical protein [uncultured Roseobacter sp.]